MELFGKMRDAAGLVRDSELEGAGAVVQALGLSARVTVGALAAPVCSGPHLQQEERSRTKSATPVPLLRSPPLVGSPAGAAIRAAGPSPEAGRPTS